MLHMYAVICPQTGKSAMEPPICVEAPRAVLNSTNLRFYLSVTIAC